MHALDLGWLTDIEVLERSGSQVEEKGDHVIVRTPDNPTYHWGNYLLVVDPEAVDDAERWVSVFQAAFPEAHWIAIALGRMPNDVQDWNARGLELECHHVLVATEVPRQTARPDAYEVRCFRGDDWEQAVRLEVAENSRAGSWEPASFEAFARKRIEIQRGLCESGETAAYFGASADGELAANLGIVRCGAVARYQDVLTGESHRRRGVASHLLGVAGRWAADRGCNRWVIVTEEANPAERVYRNAGFGLDSTNVQAYRGRLGKT